MRDSLLVKGLILPESTFKSLLCNAEGNVISATIYYRHSGLKNKLIKIKPHKTHFSHSHYSSFNVV